MDQNGVTDLPTRLASDTADDLRGYVQRLAGRELTLYEKALLDAYIKVIAYEGMR
jgi:hypothetical protein